MPPTRRSSRLPKETEAAKWVQDQKAEREARVKRKNNMDSLIQSFNAKPLAPSADMPTEALGGPMIKPATFVYPKPQSTGLSQEFGRLGGRRRRKTVRRKKTKRIS